MREAVQAAAGVSLAVLLIASALAWVIAGTRPGAAADAAHDRAGDHRDRPDAAARHPGRRRDRRARRARSTRCSTGWRPRSQPARVRLGRRPRAAHADHDRARTPRAARRRPTRARGDGRAGHRRARPHGALRRGPAALAKAEQGDFLHARRRSTSTCSPTSSTRRPRRSADRDWRLAGSGTGRLTADRQRLTQAVMQLAQNAAEHTATATASRGPASAAARHGCGSPTAGRASHRGTASGSSIVSPAPAATAGDRTAPASAWRSCARSPRRTGPCRGRQRGRAAGATFTLIIPTEPPQEDDAP